MSADRTATSHGTLRTFLLRGGAWALLGRIATVVAALGVHALVARLLPPAEVGRFFVLYSIVLVARTAGRLGVGRTVVRLLGPIDPAAHTERARPVLANAFAVVTGGGLAVASLLATGPGAMLLSALNAPASPHLRGLAALWTLALVFEGFAAEAFRGLRQIARAVLFNGLLSSGLLVIGLLTWSTIFDPGGGTQLRPVVGLAALAAVLASTTSLVLLRRSLPRPSTSRVSKLDWMTILGPSLPILGSTMLAILIDQLGLWMLSAWCQNADQLALYGTAQRLTRLVVTPLLVANAVLPPILAKLAAHNEQRTLSATLRLSASATSCVAGAAALVIILGGGPLMGFVFGAFYRQAAPIVAVLAVAQLVLVASGSCGIMLLMAGHQRTHLAVNLATMGALAGGGIVLGDSINAQRMAWVVLAATVLQQLVCMLAVHRRIGVWTFATLSPRRVREDWRHIEMV